MSDALLSPAVGGTMWAVTGITLAASARRVGREVDSRKVPLMGVLAAFVFAAQMINFTIPGTGSSGHLGGGLILAALLGPSAAFLSMASILTVQALFFADGGLLALGCNIFNLGFFPAFVAYPLLFRPIAGKAPSSRRLTTASLAAAVVGLQLGAAAVIAQTTFSGVAELNYPSFAALMLPIHLVIGIAEGLVTAAVVSFVWKARPEVLRYAAEGRPHGALAAGRVVAALAVAALLAGGVLSWFASTHPDGLEWSLTAANGSGELQGPEGGVHEVLGALQEKTALLPDYAAPGKQPAGGRDGEKRGGPSVETSLAGLVGGVFSLLAALAVAWVFRGRHGGAPPGGEPPPSTLGGKRT